MKKWFLGLILSLSSVASANPPIIWGPHNQAQLLQPGLSFGPTFSGVSSGTADPTSVAQYGVKGSIYLNAADGFWYRKTDAGTSTNWSLLAGTGTVTSIGLTGASVFSISGSPVTTAGTINVGLASQANNLVFAGSAASGTGVPTFRALVSADIPNLDFAKITTGIVPVAQGGSNKALTLAAGGILWTDADSFEVSAASAGTGQFLRSTGALAPTWSTASLPATATTGDLLYASATNVWSSLAKANTSAFITDSSGVPAWTSGSTANRVLRTNGTTVSFAQIDVSTDTIGTLGTGKGGTGTATTFGQGSVVFAGGSGVYTQDSANFFWDDTLNTLGIGNNSPLAPLHISGLTYVGTPSSSLGSILRVAAINFTDNNTAALGTASGYNYASVSQGTLVATNASVTTTTATTLRVGGAPIAGTNETIGTATSLEVLGGTITGTVATGYGLQVSAPSGATANYAAVFTGGKVGIGTSTPTSALQVTGTVTAGTISAGPTTTTTIGATDITSATVSTGTVSSGTGSAAAPSISFSGDTDTGLFNISPNILGATTAGTERLRVDAIGGVAVGTTAANASALMHLVSVTRGFLMPVMTTTQGTAIVSPATGLMHFDSTLNAPKFYNGTAWRQTQSTNFSLQTLSSGTAATYTTPTGVSRLHVRMVGGGGGGGGGSAQTGDGGTSTGGTATTWAVAVTGGTNSAGGGGGTKNTGGTGGTSTLGSAYTGFAYNGGAGNEGPNGGASGAQEPGNAGASSPFGGAGKGASTGGAAVANTGSGGGGGIGGTAAAPNGGLGGGGGGAGGYIEFWVSSPAATYTYTIGSKGTGGTAGTNGGAGGDGSVGVIIVEEYY